MREGGRVERGNERGRDWTMHGRREGGSERRREGARKGGSKGGKLQGIHKPSHNSALAIDTLFLQMKNSEQV